MATSTTLQQVQWIKLRMMQVFWPAVVYRSYSEAIAHIHDVSRLRHAKPALDAEDCVIYFFGVGPQACRVRSNGPAPNVQLCVAHQDDVTAIDWNQGVDNIVALSRSHGVNEDTLERTLKSICFTCAVDEAKQFYSQVEACEQNRDQEVMAASKFFVSLLVKAQPASQQQHALQVPEQLVSPSKPAKKASTHQAMSSSFAASCWQQMLQDGWETMTQANGQVLYKMPGTSFFNFRPNINIFDSLEQACLRYLSLWVQEHGSSMSDDSKSTMAEFFWPLLQSNGWESLSTASETWFMMPNTPFDKCVPNVTIFRTKDQAIAKYLETSGLLQSVRPQEKEEPANEPSSNDDDVQMADGEHDQVDDGDDNEEVVEVPPPTKKSAVKEAKKTTKKSEPKATEANKVKAEKPQKSTTTKPSKPTKPAKQPAPPKRSRVTIPPFKVTFGKLESALKQRGWFIQTAARTANGYQYCTPQCRSKPKDEWIDNVDVFRDRVLLEDYLETSGLQDSLVAELQEEHRRSYLSPSSDDDEGEEQPTKPSTKPSTQRKKARRESPVVELPRKKDQRNNTKRSASKTPSRCTAAAASSASRRREPSRSTPNLSDIKFGEIWKQLAEKGWHYKPSPFGYDYFQPHCEKASDGEMNVDYFPSRDALIDYLHTSGLWQQTANEIRREQAVDMTRDEEEEEAQPVPKSRRRSMSTSSSSSSKRKLVNPHDGDDSEVSEAEDNKRSRADAITPKARDQKKQKTVFETPHHDNNEEHQEQSISPEAASNKASAHAQDAPQINRNLADSFTPSPSHDKKTSRVTPTEEQAPEQDAFSTVLSKVTPGYTPSNFKHRKAEKAKILDFLSGCFSKRQGGSLYISGSPGCGKTALLQSLSSEIVAMHEQSESHNMPFHRVLVNAMSINDASTLFCQLASTLSKKHRHLDESDGDEALRLLVEATNTTSKRPKMMLLVLDEIDALLKKTAVERDLYRLFELAHREHQAFVLIGIANQVDFTERHLPFLQHLDLVEPPQVVVFQPYTYQTIEQILIERLGGRKHAETLVNAHGLAFLARKIASTSGDIRMALDICRRILHQRPSRSAAVSLSDMLRTIKLSLESRTSQVLQSLPRTLQMIVFAVNKRALSCVSPATTLYAIDDVYACYCQLSEAAGVFKPLNQREFKSSLETLASEGLFYGPDLHKKQLIKMLCTPSEVLRAFRNDPYFTRLF